MSSSSEQADETVALARPGSNGSDSAARKRKRSEEGVALSEKVKKQKRNQQERKRKRLQSVRDEYLDGNLNVDKSYAHMSNGLLADQIGQRARQFGGELSAVELDDMRVPESAIRDTSGFDRDRTMENMPDFLRQYSSGDPADTPEAKGSPHTIVVSGAGILCADLTRILRVFESSKETHILKLFAKHQKIEEAAQKLARSRTPIVVGTPHRLLELVNRGHLKVEELKRIAVNASQIDQKKRGILDMKETFLPMVKLLTRKDFKARYDGAAEGGQRLELLFY